MRTTTTTTTTTRSSRAGGSGRWRAPRPPGAPTLELTFQRQVEQLAHTYGWRIYHVEDSRRDRRGFPDLWMVRASGQRSRPPRLLVAELKNEIRAITAEQVEWLGDLSVLAQAIAAAAGAAFLEVYVWRPADLTSMAITEILRRETPTTPPSLAPGAGLVVALETPPPPRRRERSAQRPRRTERT